MRYIFKWVPHNCYKHAIGDKHKLGSLCWDILKDGDRVYTAYSERDAYQLCALLNDIAIGMQTKDINADS